jgi:hypothetical protein
VLANRVLSEAIVEGRVRGLASTIDDHGCRRLTPEGLYGRRKMTVIGAPLDADRFARLRNRVMRSLGSCRAN